MLGMITRLTEQKGIDLVCSIIDELVKLNVQLVILGTGDSKYENLLKEYSKKYSDNVSANILFDNTLAQRIYAASDMFLMPSEFEPCGIGQLIALRYGSIPIVRKTGGLKDTINNYDENPSCATGFQFNNLNSAELMDSIVKALNIYNDKNEWSKLIKNAMSVDNSWSSSARSYIELYKTAMGL
jgi:starch synthase